MKNLYEGLGVKRIINAAGTYTILGGSKMSDATLAAMGEASRSYVRIRELQQKVNGEIARMTRNEAAYVPNGAAAGLYLAIAAAIEQKHGGKRFYYMRPEEIRQYNIAMFKAHRNPYDLVIGQLGAEYREISFPNLIFPPTAEDLAQAIDHNTAAVYYAMAGWTAAGDMPLEEVIAIAKPRGVPVIVDAAAQLPPVENLWRLTGLGADVVLFSGGKDLRGPQASGLMVGRGPFLETVTALGFPNYGIGRMLKVGREELVGLYAAICQYLEMDHDARLAWCEAQVKMAGEALAASTVFSASRSFPNEAGQPIPRALVRITRPGVTVEAVRNYLLADDPGVYVLSEAEGTFFLNPMSLEEGEMELILGRLAQFESGVR